MARIALLTLALMAVSPASGQVTAFDKFQLWNDCLPIHLIIETLSDDATEIELTEERIETVVRSRLRAARLYDQEEIAWLYVNMNIVGGAFSMRVELNKRVRDDATFLPGFAITWNTSSTGTHGGGGNAANFVLSSLAEKIDRFIDEYLRVNDEACSGPASDAN